MKPENVTIVAVTNNNNTIFGLGSDQMMYQWNMLDGTWRAFSVKNREDTAKAHEDAEAAHQTPTQ